MFLEWTGDVCASEGVGKDDRGRDGRKGFELDAWRRGRDHQDRMVKSITRSGQIWYLDGMTKQLARARMALAKRHLQHTVYN